MREFIELSERLAKEVIKIENSRKELGRLLREMASERIAIDKDVLEDRIVIPVERLRLDKIRVGGVDGGLVKKSLHGIDIRLSRAVAVIFNFSDGKLQRVDYYPSPIPSPIPNIIFYPYSELELELSCGMERQILEASVAAEAIEKLRPEVLLMHGSIIPHPSEKPSPQSPVYPTYMRMMETYRKLFQTALANETLLAGVVEDSRALRFCEILGSKIFPVLALERRMKIAVQGARDTALLSYVLEEGERTFAFSYSSSPESHPILKDFGGMNGLFASFYLQAVKFDRPIRIDMFTSEVKNVGKLASILLSLAGHGRYGIPSVLVEADQRARLSERDLELFYHDLINRVGNIPTILALRRDERPF